MSHRRRVSITTTIRLVTFSEITGISSDNHTPKLGFYVKAHVKCV
jgi:hypothetical protein